MQHAVTGGLWVKMDARAATWGWRLSLHLNGNSVKAVSNEDLTKRPLPIPFETPRIIPHGGPPTRLFLQRAKKHAEELMGAGHPMAG